jgi:2-polyprenyl-3-methyl-5-hydroxy-6-metoxy-1,4-benzoquinol methylase
MKCKVCTKQTTAVFEARMLGKYTVTYYHCQHCGFLQTEEPYWLDEAYKSPINIMDTGILSRNIRLSEITAALLYSSFDTKKKYLDFAGGYGIFTRLMRDVGFDFYWHDPYTENMVSRGFEYDGNESDDIELITSFESFEHFTNPLEEIEKMLKISKNIIFSTSLIPKTIPKPEQWWYYGLEHGQHISFFSYKTLEYIAQKYDLNLYSDKEDIHMLTTKKIANFDRVIKRLKKRFYRYLLLRRIKKKLDSKTRADMNYIMSKMPTAD